MTTASLPRRTGVGSMVLGLPAGRRRDEGHGGGTRGARRWCDGKGRDRAAGGDRGPLLPSGFWGDGVGPIPCHVPAPHPGGCRGLAGGRQCRRYLSAGGWGRTTSSLLWGPGIPSPGTSPCGTGTAVTPAGDENTLGGELPQMAPGGIRPSGLTCRAPGRAGARCRGPSHPGPHMPCRPQPLGRPGSVPSRRTWPLASPASYRSGRRAAAHTGARRPGMEGF